MMSERRNCIETHFALLQTLHPVVDMFKGCAEIKRRQVIADDPARYFGTGTAIFTFEEQENWHGELLELLRFLIEGNGLYWATAQLNPHAWVGIISDEAIVFNMPPAPRQNHEGSKISPAFALLRAYLKRNHVNIPTFEF